MGDHWSGGVCRSTTATLGRHGCVSLNERDLPVVDKHVCDESPRFVSSCRLVDEWAVGGDSRHGACRDAYARLVEDVADKDGQLQRNHADNRITGL